MFPYCQLLNDVPSNNQDVFLLLWLALDGEVSSSVLDVLLLSLNIYSTILLHDLEFMKWVESGSIFNVTSCNAEASLNDKVSYDTAVSTLSRLTTVPWASNSAIRSHYTLYKRGTIMRAVCVHGVNLSIDLDEKDLASLEAFYFGFLLLTILQVDLGKILELELGSHCSDRGRELCKWLSTSVICCGDCQSRRLLKDTRTERRRYQRT